MRFTAKKVKNSLSECVDEVLSKITMAPKL